MTLHGPYLKLKQRLGLTPDLEPIVLNPGQRRKLEGILPRMSPALWPDDDVDVALDRIRNRPKVTISFSEDDNSYIQWKFE